MRSLELQRFPDVREYPIRVRLERENESSRSSLRWNKAEAFIVVLYVGIHKQNAMDSAPPNERLATVFADSATYSATATHSLCPDPC